MPRLFDVNRHLALNVLGLLAGVAFIVLMVIANFIVWGAIFNDSPMLDRFVVQQSCNNNKAVTK